MEEDGTDCPFDLLAAETVENIFKKFESREQLFSLRVVCGRWNDLATSVLGQETAALEMEWHPTQFSIAESNSTVPKWVVLPTEFNVIREVYNPNGEKMLGIQANTMEFPTQSLHLVIQAGSEEKSSLQSKTKEPESLCLLFKHSGSWLRCLCISGVKVPVVELHNLLSETPNLRVLKIFEKGLADWSLTSSSRPEVSGDALPEVQHLSLKTLCWQTCCWLLESFSESLLTLELHPFEVVCRGSKAKIRVKQFPKLKNLKLVVFGNSFLMEFNKISMKKLERISITQELGSPKALLNFVSRFQTTLVELTLNYVTYWKEIEIVTDAEPPRFQKLKQLYLVTDLFSPWSRAKLFDHLFLSSFPKIETLQLVNLYPLSQSDALAYSSFHGHWNISPSLKSIQWLTGHLNNETVENHIFTRQD